jgi:His Kinase A (phospho-acceptor) domain
MLAIIEQPVTSAGTSSRTRNPVRFDDRLLTVLNQPAANRHDIAVRWRQLVDLVARAGSSATNAAVSQALDSIRSDASNVDEGLRAAAARAVASLPLPLGLLEYFASDRLSVSAPVLAAATLDAAQWRGIMRTADEETRRFIATLHPELRSEVAQEPSPSDLTNALIEAPAENPSPTTVTPSLHEVVQRIERRRRTRSTNAGRAMVSGEGAPALFRWECGPGGEIAWVDGAPRGALIGRSIARGHSDSGDRLDPEVARAFNLRAPFRDAALTFAGESQISGDWKISGVPAFDPADGRFRGYRGIALREAETADEMDPATEFLSDPDSLRELVHEIKTPLNAIIGFAEIIDGQYLGPAEARYRERARDIVRHARLLLTAIDDLDFAARVRSSEAGQRLVNLGELLEQMTPAVRDLATSRNVEVDGSRATRDAMAAAEPELADRLIFRMCSALIERAEPGERLLLGIDRADEHWRVSITLPKSLSGLAEDQLLGGDPNFDQGFGLRLLRGLARLAEAELVASPGLVSLLFPRA